MPARQCGIIVLLLAVSLLPGCGGSTFDIQNPPPPPPQDVTIAFASPPPGGVSLNDTVSLTANVANDPTNAGVDWALTCANQSSFSCGSLSSAHTDSGQPITFTPPSAFSGNTDNVNIVAYATASHPANVDAPITVTAFGNVLQGTYVFQVKGSDSTFSFDYPYQLTGQIYLDGNGNVAVAPGGNSAGQQTLNTFDVNSVLDSTTSQIAGGSYFVGTDGRGLLILDTTDPEGDVLEEGFSLVVTSSSEVLLAQLGGTLSNNQGSNSLVQSGTGTLQLQDQTAIGTLPSAGFAFAASGTDSSSTPIVYGGIVNIDTPDGISGNGTLTDQGYNGVFSSCSSAKGFAGSSVSSTGTPGIVTVNFVTSCSGFGPTQLTGYVVDSSHIQLIETDGTFFTAGLAAGQGPATGTFTSFSGNYIFNAIGTDLSSFLPSSLTSVNVINADANGNLTGGYTDTAFFSDTNGNAALIDTQITGTYQLDNNGIGRVHLRFIPAPAPFFDPSLVLYLTAPAGTPGAPALVLYSAAANQRYPALGVGIAYPQQPALSLSFGDGEQYGLLLTQQNGSENDGSGEMTASSNIGTGGTLSGSVDESVNGFAVSPVSLAGAFACPQGAPCPDSFGRFSASTLTIDGAASPVDYFLIDQDHGLFIETDTPDSFQVTLGSFTQRCDVTLSGDCQQAAGKSSRRRGSKPHKRSHERDSARSPARSN